MSGYGAGIRRGVMAGDRFTKISNALFRDPRISFKAKGLFGLISTHRDGWRVTVAELARCSTDGRDAINSGVKELEKYSYLVRDRARNEDGTLGEVVYAITDMPAHLYDLFGDDAPGAAVPQTRRSHPMTGYPVLDNPAQADPEPKKTKRKKTNKQKTNPVHPSVRDAPAPARERQLSAPAAPPEAPDRIEATAGVRLLLAIGAQYPELLLTGPALHDQGQIATALLESGWRAEQVEHVIAGRPLPRPVRTSVAAIVAARLRAAQSTPPPRPAVLTVGEPSGSGAADRSPAEAVARRVLVECAACGNPGPAAGEDLCPACLNWPPCTTCTGPTPRRAHPNSDGRCTPCTLAAASPWNPAGSGS
ncbi:hypothetical protein ACFYMW_36480 [Streptomyces sp. NPDC006692]|uniref:hypothetical protein n=1 Tax=unclassified Streptomyces TaxID=2593676 RepID=UPI00368F929D